MQSLRYGITTNHNESLHHILSEIVPKKLRATIDTVKLGAALAIIRYNDGYKAVLIIFSSLSQSGHFTRTQKAFRLHDNKRIMASGSIKRKKGTTTDEEASTMKRSNRTAMHGKGYSSGAYSGAIPVERSSSDQEVTKSDD